MRTCNLSKCRDYGYWSNWSTSGKCKRCKRRVKACAKLRLRYRRRNCYVPEEETKACILHGCPIDGGWDQWSGFSACDVTCGVGYRIRQRFCTNPAAANGGANCTGPMIESQTCNIDGCPMHGGWSNWSEFGLCDVTCGGGIQIRRRSCTNPIAANGGANCTGLMIESQACNTKGCPVNGGWSSWSEFGTCDKTCGGGTQIRKRSCSNPPAVNGGANCTGPMIESRACNLDGCPVSGGWSKWSTFGACDKTCGGGEQFRTRNCTNPPPSNGGTQCAGSKVETKDCNTQACFSKSSLILIVQWLNLDRLYFFQLYALVIVRTYLVGLKPKVNPTVSFLENNCRKVDQGH